MTLAIYYICVRILHAMTGNNDMMFLEMLLGIMLWIMHILFYGENGK